MFDVYLLLFITQIKNENFQKSSNIKLNYTTQ